ncbi:hypothetical protein BC629DRAFT_1594700 [Irpex lacteus]|nr:hypothetical protein BC629DRAFT_1594700 [Irpex lacteus]
MPPSPEAPCLDVFSMRDMCVAAVPVNAPTALEVRASVAKIQEEAAAELIPTILESSHPGRAPSGALEIVTNRDRHSRVLARKKRSGLRLGLVEEETDRDNMENTENIQKYVCIVRVCHSIRNSGNLCYASYSDETGDESDDENAPVSETTVHDESVLEAVIDTQAVATTNIIDVDAIASDEESDEENTTLANINKGKGRAVDESDDEVCDEEDSEEDYDSDSSCLTPFNSERDSDSEDEVESVKATIPAQETRAATFDAGTKVGASSSATGSRKRKPASATATSKAATAALASAERVWKAYLAKSKKNKDPRGKGEENPIQRNAMPDPTWKTSLIEPHIESAENGYVPCPFEDCPCAFSVARVKIIKHFVQHHYNDKRFKHVKHVLAWLALPKQEVPKGMCYPCIFQGTELESKECGGAHGYDGYGRHLAESHTWEGLVNFRCTKCDVKFYARDGTKGALCSAHLKDCPFSEYYERPEKSKSAGGRRSTQKASRKLKNGKAPTSSRPTKTNKKRKDSHESDDEYSGAGSSKRRCLRSSA